MREDEQKSFEYIDVHSHILPGIDDGAIDKDMALQMLEMAYQQGIRIIITTPHYYVTENNNAKVEDAFYFLCEQAKRIDENFNIYLGNEIYYREGCLEHIKNGMAKTLADSRYVLIEFDPQIPFQRMYQGLKEIIQEGYAPIIAHVERYYCLWKKMERMYELIKLGCYMQMNCKSLMGNMLNSTSNYCRRLVKEGYIHLLGSDSHDSKYRVPIMKDCLNQLEKKINQEILQNISVTNGNKIIKNMYI